MAFVLVIAAVFLFLLAATTFTEKQMQGVVVSLSALIATLLILALFLHFRSRGRLEGIMARRCIQGALGLLVLFVILMLVPTQRTIESEACGTTEIVGNQGRYDSREQPGAELYVKMSGSVQDDVLTLTIYDICVGKLSHRVHRDGEIKPERVEITNREVLTEYIKKEARALGASVVGVAALQPEYVFTHDQKGTPIHLPHKYAIVIGLDLSYRLSGPSAPLPWEELYSSIPEELAAALAGEMVKSTQKISEKTLKEVKQTLRFFSEGGKTAVELAHFIRNLGYPARAHYQRWSEVQIVPLAIKAGLGELGRNGMLISRELGPRGSFSVVTTDLPLIPDRPVDLGIKEFCSICKKCARSCPVQALPYGGPRVVRGVKKWVLDGEKCSDYLVSNPKCMACIYSCPFNKPDYFIHRLANFFAGRKSAVANFLLVKLDDILGYGKTGRSGSSNTRS
ncbi:MAG: reductive dehalogenase [Deltaproteobacteria bacterium]|nr:reductive dehalogenase [Deltaproteobacteria bacterium]